MTQAIIVALITGCFTLTGTIITVVVTNRKAAADMQKEIAVIRTEMNELTREVRAHNNFAQRMPVVEEKINALDKRLSKVECA